uniref:PHD-type domain-containing protein n=1 Tax=Ganoderma boninense TaxID=34458 RepID=A0A5K1K3Z2_9APHY|nr:PHD-type domain-containing protein [Ganoderma boninense]
MTLLFSLAAPTLRTLCMIAGNPSVLLPAFPYGPLPSLEELAVHHSLHLFFPGDFACKHMWNSNFAFQLPALRRLHMVHHFWSDPSDSRVLTRLAQYNPLNLTHVRISGLSVPPEGFLDDLRRVLGVFHPLPGGGPGPQYLGCGTISFEWLDLCIEVRRIAQLVKQSRDDDVAVIPLCRPPRRNWRWPDRLFDEWVSRIEGGAGCWVESEDEEAKLEVYEDDHALPEMLEWPLPDSDDDL